MNNESNKPQSRDDFEKYFNSLKNFDELKILILGLGDIGQKLAQKLNSLGAKIDSFSRTTKNLKFINKEIKFNDSNIKIEVYYFIVSLLPDNESTKDILDFNFFKRLSKNAIFINAGRGNTVMEKDLIKSLNLGSPKLALLDVIKNEPLSIEDPIYTHPKTIVTPHIFAFSPSWSSEIELFENNLNFYLLKNHYL